MLEFEKITFNQFKKDIKKDKTLYDSYELSIRSSQYIAGYDFKVIESFVIKPRKNRIISNGVKAYMGNIEMLILLIRNSMGFKYNTRMCNQG
jgi:dUTPase